MRSRNLCEVRGDVCKYFNLMIIFIDHNVIKTALYTSFELMFLNWTVDQCYYIAVWKNTLSGCLLTSPRSRSLWIEYYVQIHCSTMQTLFTIKLGKINGMRLISVWFYLLVYNIKKHIKLFCQFKQRLLTQQQI